MDEDPNCGACRSADEPNIAPVNSRDLPDASRRRLLTAMGGVGAGVLAGCLDEDDDDVVAHVVVFLDNDEGIEVEIDEDEELLYPALDAGVDIPYSCEVGRCGQCTAKYDGDANDIVVHEGNQYLDEDQIEAGWVLTCVAYARDDFELEVAHPDDE